MKWGPKLQLNQSIKQLSGFVRSTVWPTTVGRLHYITCTYTNWQYRRRNAQHLPPGETPLSQQILDSYCCDRMWKHCGSSNLAAFKNVMSLAPLLSPPSHICHTPSCCLTLFPLPPVDNCQLAERAHFRLPFNFRSRTRTENPWARIKFDLAGARWVCVCMCVWKCLCASAEGRLFICPTCLAPTKRE